jgi:hypothetical protein
MWCYPKYRLRLRSKAGGIRTEAWCDARPEADPLDTLARRKQSIAYLVRLASKRHASGWVERNDAPALHPAARMYTETPGGVMEP